MEKKSLQKAAQGSLEYEFFPQLIAQGKRLYAFLEEKPFIDIGIPQDYLRAFEFLQGLHV